MGSSPDREHNKREIERTIGNLSHAIEHLKVVGSKFYDVSLTLANSNQDVPDQYVEILTSLNTFIEGLELIRTGLEELNKTI